jgi:hydroxypyruvate reductase
MFKPHGQQLLIFGMKKYQMGCESMCTVKRTNLIHLFLSGVSAVKGNAAVKSWLEFNVIAQPTHILAVGKAAASMFEGLPSEWRAFTPTLLVTKTGHLADTDLGRNVMAIEAGHPVPDSASLVAGKQAKLFVESCGKDSHLLILISGGASSLVEHLQEEFEYSDLVALTKAALADGADISVINRRRNAVSAIKGGRLLSGFCGHKVTTLAISDLPPAKSLTIK